MFACVARLSANNGSGDGFSTSSSSDDLPWSPGSSFAASILDKLQDVVWTVSLPGCFGRMWQKTSAYRWHASAVD